MIEIALDRIALEDTVSSPEEIAHAIHDQLGYLPGKVPIKPIAKALDIVEIREESLDNIEGALITTPEKGYGSILINLNSGRQRQHFTIAHELGHYLIPSHQAPSPNMFACSGKDFATTSKKAIDRYALQEAEANRFAIELLAPVHLVRNFTSTSADLEQVIQMATQLDISKQAAVRRYVELHHQAMAVIFSKNGKLHFYEASDEFPALTLSRDDPVPGLPGQHEPSPPSPIQDTDPSLWIERPVELTAQTLLQQEGHAMTLLRAWPN